MKKKLYCRLTKKWKIFFPHKKVDRNRKKSDLVFFLLFSNMGREKFQSRNILILPFLREENTELLIFQYESTLATFLREETSPDSLWVHTLQTIDNKFHLAVNDYISISMYMNVIVFCKIDVISWEYKLYYIYLYIYGTLSSLERYSTKHSYFHSST